jgi:hypothetical protein
MKIISGLLLLLSFFTFSAQSELISKSLLELEKNIFEKSFSKKWKKSKQEDWEKKCSEIKDVNEANVLFNEYSDLLAQTASFSMGNSDAKTEYELAVYLLKVEQTLTKELTSNWVEADRAKWREGLEVYVAAIEQKKKDDDLMRKFHIVTGIVKSFEKNFPIVWEDAKKNAFKSILTGDIKAGVANTSLEFKGGSKEGIKEDEYGVRSYYVFFDAENDPLLAKKIFSEIEGVIITQVGEGYKKTNEQDAAFENNNKFVYQFEGEKFSETAKKPTVVIGVNAKTLGVYLEVIEPVFGH